MMSILKEGNNPAVFPEGRLGHAEGLVSPFFYLGFFRLPKN